MYYVHASRFFLPGGVEQEGYLPIIAGSILQLFDAIKNVCDWSIATVEQAIRMASAIPEKSCNIDDMCGSLQSGHDADFLVIDPKLNLDETYLDGKSIYKKEN